MMIDKTNFFANSAHREKWVSLSGLKYSDVQYKE